MSNDIRIRKGLDIKLVGGAATKITDLALASEYAIKPEDFHLVVPKLIAKEGIEVQAGETIFFDKKNESILFASPVSGKITEIVRGERRRILAIKIQPSAEQHFKNHGKKNAEQMNEAQVKEFLLSAGAWPFIKQRPYDVIANPNVAPKAIFISACKTAPLAPNYSFALAGKEEALQQAVTALSKLTKGKVHVGVAKDDSTSPFRKLQNITLHNVSGPHPAGNVSTQIAQIDPINKGEVVWVVTPQDLLVIGNLFLTGELRIERVAALAGADVKNPQYIRVIAGAKMADVVKGQVENLSATRVISGDVLTGKTANDGYLGFYDDQITAIPEGNDYEFFGWALPTASKISQTRSLTFSWLGGNNKEYNLNTNTNGEHRAFVVTGLYEEVFPLDIYPMHLLKACKYQDLDELENLGAYEVAPEDFALTEFVCPSKQPHQKIIREGLDLMMQELG